MANQKVSNLVTLLFVALFSSSFLYLLIGFILSRSGWHPFLTDVSIRRLILYSLLGASLLILVAVIQIKKKAFPGESLRFERVDDFRKYVSSRCAVLFALSEVPAVFGLFCFFVTGNFRFQVFFTLISLVAFSIAKPSNEMLEQIQRTIPQRTSTLFKEL
jgi:hypothetical protein